jgi:transcriptional regulator with XRE-family HTH domain
MATMERARDRGRHQARSIATSIGMELREARLAAGVSQAHVAQAADLRQSRVSRTERVADPMPRLDELTRHCAAVGLRLSVRAYPAGSPVRDAAQLKLIARFRSLLSGRFHPRTEVPVGSGGDLRAWDLVLDGPVSVAVDAETRLRDMQALQRRVELKWRDSGVPRVVLVVPPRTTTGQSCGSIAWPW